ncbi:MFS transporter [Hydrogenophaga soli]
MHARQFVRQTPYLAWVMLYCAVTWGLFGVTLGLVTPNLRAQLHLRYEDMGLLMALWATASVVGSLLGGAVAHRQPPRRLFLVYATLATGLLVVLSQAQSFGVLVASFVLIAMAESALFTLGHGVLASLSTDAELRTRIIGLVDVGYSLGTLLAPLWVSAWFAHDPAWRGPYTGFVVLMALLGLLLSPPAPYRTLKLHAGDAAEPAGPDAPAVQAPSASDGGYGFLLRQPVVRFGLTAAALIGFVEWGQNFWLVSYVQQGLDWGETLARQAVFALMGGMLAGRIWQTFVPSRWTMNQKIRHLGSLCVLGLLAQNGAGWLGQLVPAWLAAGQVGVVVASLAVGLGVSVAFPILLGTLVHAQPQQASRLSALTMIAICLGAALASQSIGRLADLWGMDSAFALLLLSALGYRLALRPLGRVTEAAPADAPSTPT